MLEGNADQNTPPANLRYLLGGLAGLLANLFSVYVGRENYINLPHKFDGPSLPLVPAFWG